MDSHPLWYYRRYKDIFLRKQNYEQEIAAIKSITSLDGQRVQEIGAGTGEFAEKILNCRVAHLEVVDYDPIAVEILRKRFAHQRNVSVIQANGFARAAGGQEFDVIIAMYSIILEDIFDKKNLEERILQMTTKLANKGVAIFEWIDAEISEKVYPQGMKSVVYENKEKDEIVLIESIYTPDTVTIKYSGKLEKEIIEYEAHLLSVTWREITSILENVTRLTGGKFGMVPIESLRRRVLGYVQKN